MANIRWKDKSAITLATDDRIPVTDISATNTDGYTTPASILALGSWTDSGSIVSVTDGRTVSVPSGSNYVRVAPTEIVCNRAGTFYVYNNNASGILQMGVTGSVLGITINASGQVGVLKSPSVALDVDGPIRCKSYTVATVPSAGAGAGQIIYVTDESGGAVLAFSDNTNWRRVTDRAIIS